MNPFVALMAKLGRALLRDPASPPPRKSAAERRLDEDARRALHLANREAQRLRHEYLGTEHILLGILRAEAGAGAEVLASLGVGLDAARAAVVRRVREGPDVVTLGKLPQTPRARNAVEHAGEEARFLGDDHVGTAHLMLGLLREDRSEAAAILAELGITLERVRAEIGRCRGGSDPPGSP